MKALLVALVLFAGACGDVTPNASSPDSGPASTSTTDAPAPLSARIVLPSTTMAAGTRMDGAVIVENNTGSALHVTGCGSPVAVALGSDTVEPGVAWTMCAQPITVPVGESTWPVVVAASYSSCAGDTTDEQIPRCVDDGIPPLPPGDYEARLYQNPVIVPEPPPIAVRVTP